MTDVEGEFPTVTLFRKVEESKVIKDDHSFRNITYEKKEKDVCKIVYDQDNIKGYFFGDKIWVYYGSTNEGTDQNPMEDNDKQLIYLIIKEDSIHGRYMYIKYINNNIIEQRQHGIRLGKIIEIIKTITLLLKINKIILWDDAHFYCNNKKEYAVTSRNLRALDEIKKVEELSIYQKYGFQATKKANIEGCIEAIRSINCTELYTVSKAILDILNILNILDIKTITYSLYKINVDYMTLQISYDTLKISKLKSYPNVFRQYKENLQNLISLLEKKEDGREVSIYQYYINFSEIEQCDKLCELRQAFLSCLENEVNSYVIIVKGEESSRKRDDTECDVKIVQEGETNAINITKIFNLFYGTFKKLNYMYNEMVLNI